MIAELNEALRRRIANDSKHRLSLAVEDGTMFDVAHLDGRVRVMRWVIIAENTGPPVAIKKTAAV